MRPHICWSCLVFLLFAGLALPAAAAPITYAEAVLADDPFAYWRFGELAGATVASDSAGDHDGIYSSAGIELGAPGIQGGDSGAFFDGVDGRVTVPDDAELGPDLISMEALVQWEGPNGIQQRILEKSFFAGGEQASYNLVILDDGRMRVEVRSGGSATVHTTTAALAAGDTAYLVGVFDGTSVLIYLDGILLQTSAAAAGTLQDGINPLGIGNQAERDRPFFGLIDELALYDYALSGEQVGSHFAALSALAIAEPNAASLLLVACLWLAVFRRRLRFN